MFNGRQAEHSLEVIESDSFWGNVAIADFQESRAIPLQIPIKLVENALIYAMASLELDLNDVAERYQKQGYQSIADVPSPQFNGKNYLQMQYEKAVFARAKAELLPEFATLSARELHEKRDVMSEQRTLQAEATLAIRSLKGKSRGTAELI